MLPRSQQVHVAEVFLGGIIKRKQMVIATPGSNPNESPVIATPGSNPNESHVIATSGSNPQQTARNESASSKTNEITPETNADDIEFEFITEDVRNNFLDAAPVTD